MNNLQRRKRKAANEANEAIAPSPKRVKLESVEVFEWPEQIDYKGWPWLCEEHEIPFLNSDMKNGYEIYADFSGNTNTVLLRKNSKTEVAFYKPETCNIIKLSHALWVIGRSHPQRAYEVLKMVACMNIMENSIKGTTTLVLRDCYGIFGPAESKLLWKNIDCASVLSLLQAELRAQEKEMTQALLRPAHFEMPKKIVIKNNEELESFFKPIQPPSPYYLFLSSGGYNSIRPEARQDTQTYDFIKIMYMKVFLNRLEAAGRLSAEAVYKVLKRLVRFSVVLNKKKLKKLKLEPSAIIDSYFKIFFEDHVIIVKEDLITLIEKLTEKSKTAARIVTKPSVQGMDMLFLCGESACAPLKNSDILLDFLKRKHYQSDAFIESIFKTLQQMIPEACFLHPINIKISDDDEDDEKSYISITKHAGRNNVEVAALNMMNYGNLIDTTDTTDTSSSCRLKAIPLLIDYNGDDDHANMLIIDTTKKTCEHFEPHGANMYSGRNNSKEINTEIERVAKELCQEWFPDYTYIPRDDATNFQSVLNGRFAGSEHGGTCQVWSIWYAYLRLSHPDWSRGRIIQTSRELLGRENFAELEHFIIDFITQLNSILGLFKVGNVFYNAHGRKYI
jgi:hypothetical protein